MSVLVFYRAEAIKRAKNVYFTEEVVTFAAKFLLAFVNLQLHARHLMKLGYSQ